MRHDITLDEDIIIIQLQAKGFVDVGKPPTKTVSREVWNNLSSILVLSYNLFLFLFLLINRDFYWLGMITAIVQQLIPIFYLVRQMIIISIYHRPYP